MTKEINFESLGIPKDQIEKLNQHFQEAENFVFPQDPGMEEALHWLESNISNNLAPWSHDVLKQILASNMPDPKVEYLEQGYDSCQSHRKISKVIAESILIGGLIHEYNLLGISLGIDHAKSIIGSNLNINEGLIEPLTEIAKEYGASQDFIFPGVTPSDSNTPSLQELTFYALSGKPKTSVRTITGVGGLRFDRDWNYVTDFATFIKLKVEEDKRYYPGIGIFYALLQLPPENIPLVDNLRSSQPAVYQTIVDLSKTLKNISEKKFQGVSMLCSAYLPSWSEMKTGLECKSIPNMEIAESFHSPAYDFATLKKIFEYLSARKNPDSLQIKQLENLKDKLRQLWSFNSTIHLPWTSRLAGLSNDLVGAITNNLGDYAIRYGVGYKGKSLEIREYHFGNTRKFPPGLAGKMFYKAFFYPESDSFEGEKIEFPLESDMHFLTEVQHVGFMAAALEYLEEGVY